MSPPLLFPQPRHDLKERIPLISKQSKPHVSSAAKEYEDRLAELEQAMRDIDSERVQKIVADLNVLSKQVECEANMGSYLEKGRFSWETRQRLKQEYLDRYVLLRGGGPTYNPDGTRYTKMGDTKMKADGQKDVLSGISSDEVRHGFIMKVYSILAVQLIATSGIALLVSYWIDTYFKHNSTGALLFLMLATVVMLASICTFACFPDIGKSFPLNYIVLGVMTLAMGAIVGFGVSQYTAGSVLVAVAITAIVVIGLTAIAAFSCVDFTGWGPYLAAALLVLCGVSFLAVIAQMAGFGDSKSFESLRLLLAAVGALLFSFYIVYDTQLIIGGKHEHQYSVDDYFMAVISLYLDIINLFLNLLELVGDRK